ncbi:MAG TPA: glycosyltransferase [Thermoanaerobaculia bacterium]|jgi:glycosyltransferase involved in cell wall biosynthesis|nr:glycosyltransferase [Thermoanaerobaculia bacterium]
MSSADTTTPRLTVFTPFYQELRYFDETIASVLSQSFQDFEYLMINDGDAANGTAIEQRYNDPRIRIINSPTRLGLSGAREAGLREARGELIAFIDSDDFCEPGRLAEQVAFLDTHPDHVLVGSALRYIDEHSRTIGTRVYPNTDHEIKARMVALNCVAQPSVMARRQALIEAGGYTQEFPFAEDYDLWLRVARLGKFHNLPKPLVAYRIHTQSGKNLRLRPALKDTLRVKLRAIGRYGFPASPRGFASIALHAFLLLLPKRITYWLFRKLIVG